jgi:hypothetical protein
LPLAKRRLRFRSTADMVGGTVTVTARLRRFAGNSRSRGESLAAQGLVADGYVGESA